MDRTDRRRRARLALILTALALVGVASVAAWAFPTKNKSDGCARELYANPGDPRLCDRLPEG
jgi:hypothetical protein